MSNAGQKYGRALCLAGLGFISVSAMTPDAYARSPERPLVVFVCQDEAGPDQALCTVIAEQLSGQTAPGTILRRVEPGAEPVLRTGDIRITFILEDRNPTRLVGHLEWQVGPDEAPETGPHVRLDVMDSVLSPSLYRSYAQSLLQVSPALQEWLRSRQ